MRVKIALQSRLAYCRPGAAVSLIELAKELQVSGLELSDDREVSTAELPTIRSRLQESGIEVASFSKGSQEETNGKGRTAAGVAKGSEAKGTGSGNSPSAQEGQSQD
jgi:hypothetical protein